MTTPEWEVGGMPAAPTRRQHAVMRRIAGGLTLLAEANEECWLFDVDDAQPTYELAYRPVERIATVTAERLVLRGWVRGSGTLTPKGAAWMEAHP